jgi:hypothetical protein
MNHISQQLGMQGYFLDGDSVGSSYLPLSLAFTRVLGHYLLLEY